VKCLEDPIPLSNINAEALKKGEERFLYNHPQFATSKDLYMPRILKGLEKTIEKMNKEAQET
jgi:hypothetical protein